MTITIPAYIAIHTVDVAGCIFTVTLDEHSPLLSHQYRLVMAQYRQYPDGSTLCLRTLQQFFPDATEAHDTFNHLAKRMDTLSMLTPIIL